MKKTMLLAAGALLLSGCADTLERAAGCGDGPDGSLSVEEARALFEEVAAGRAGSPTCSDSPTSPDAAQR